MVDIHRFKSMKEVFNILAAFKKYPPQFNILAMQKRLYGRRLHFVQVIVQRRRSRFQPLPLLALLHNLVGLGAVGKGASRKNLPVVEHALWEGLASSVGPQVSGEAEGLVDRQVGLDDEHGGAGGLRLLEHVTSPSVQHTVDSSNCVLRALNFDQVYWLHNSGVSCQQTSVQDTPCCWDDLTTPTMNSISVEGHIIDVESTIAHVLICQTALLGGDGTGLDEELVNTN